MAETLSTTIACVLSAVVLFCAANIEPLPGVWLLSFAGATLAAVVSHDRGAWRFFWNISIGVFIGIGTSQLVGTIWPGLASALTRGWIAAFAGLGSQAIFTGILRGDVGALIGKIRGAPQ